MKYDRRYCQHCNLDDRLFFGEHEAEFCMGHESHKFHPEDKTKMDKVRYFLMEQKMSENEMVKLMVFLHDQIEYKKEVSKLLDVSKFFSAGIN